MEVLQVPSELKRMVALYRKAKPKRVLEIGCWYGGTLRVWLENAAPGATVVAVDLEHRNFPAYDDWQKPSTNLHLLTGSSQDPGIIEEVRVHGPYDWVFIDGDHGNAAVRSDVDVCLPLIRSGGLMLLHDITPEIGLIGLTTYPPGAVLRELAAAGYQTLELVDPEPQPVAHGIGVVHL